MAYQIANNGLSPEAAASLPVHPLQLYFVGAAVVTLIVVLALQNRLPPGRLILIFTILFFGTTALIEPFRANELILNVVIVASVAVVSAGLLLKRINQPLSTATLVRAGTTVTRRNHER